MMKAEMPLKIDVTASPRQLESSRLALLTTTMT
jgi:hypothetical protein